VPKHILQANCLQYAGIDRIQPVDRVQSTTSGNSNIKIYLRVLFETTKAVNRSTHEDNLALVGLVGGLAIDLAIFGIDIFGN
jgi:hypothetical protein